MYHRLVKREDRFIGTVYLEEWRDGDKILWLRLPSFLKPRLVSTGEILI